MKKLLLWILITCGVLVLGFFAFNSYIYHTKQAEPTDPETGVQLGVAQTIGEVRLTPEEILEDSRCPVDENVQCFWAGQLVVRISIDSPQGESEADVAEGSTFKVADQTFELRSVTPPARADGIPLEEYRFLFGIPELE